MAECCYAECHWQVSKESLSSVMVSVVAPREQLIVRTDFATVGTLTEGEGSIQLTS